MTQQTLMFAARDADRLATRVDRLLDVLSDSRWHTAGELSRVLHLNVRTVRRLADLSGGRIIGSDAGLKLTRYASNDEIDHAEARLISQAKKMTDRAREIRLARNRGAAA